MQRRALVLGLLLLLGTGAWAQEAAAKKGAKATTTAKPAGKASKPRVQVESTESKIIPSAGEAELTNGIGDVDPTGPCQADISAFCKKMTPGDSRLAMCLSKRIDDAKKGNVAGREVSDECKDDVVDFKLDRNTNINKDVPLARACKDDVAKFCKKASDEDVEGSVVACLREKGGKKLSPPCAKEVLRTQLEAAEDYRLDPRLYGACEESVGSLCDGVEPGEGRELECLMEKSKQLSWDCLDQVVRFQKEAASDIRLSTRLFKRCLNDQRRYCSEVEPGQMRVQECLEDHMDEPDFSPGCRQELDSVIARRVADFRLDPSLQEACQEDLETTCSVGPDDLADETARKTAMNCLQTYKDELKSTDCREKVHRKMRRASRDIRFDDVLSSACSEDRKAYCKDVQPGSARVIRCLQDNRATLSQQCTAALFDHEVKMAEDIDFKYPMRKSCAWEIMTFCPNVPHGHARIIRCLQKSIDHEDMSKECKDEVMRDMNRAATDYRLNWRLKHACDQDINALCTGLCQATNQPCGGVVLHCLTEKQDNITNPACQEEVFYYQLMEVNDFRNDVILAEACRGDVDKYCKDVEPGEGRVHTCLRHQINFISEACRVEENKLAAVEYRDIRLKPKLAKLCSEERAVFCAAVKPGKARVIKCLIESMGKPNFGAECRGQLQERAKVVQSDYRYDVGVQEACKADIETFCQAAKAKLRGNAAVLKCLVHSFKDTADACQAEMSRLVRFALWDFSSGSPLTSVCDNDIDTHCPANTANRPGGVFTIGAAGHCLSKALVEAKPLAPECRELVLVAAPKDARAYLQYPESTNALVQRVADLQRAAGLEGVLVDPYQREGSAVTVTGWVALLCIVSIIVVSLGTAVILYRRVTGADRPHTQYVKSGDA